MNPEQLEVAAKAINAHGTLFKKAVRREIENYHHSGLRVLDEEYPASFPNPTSIDLLVEYPGRGSQFRFILPIECKRAYALNKSWVFFRDKADTIKVAYMIGGGKKLPIIVQTDLSGFELFSEGIEVDLGKLSKSPDSAYKCGNCDTIHDAANQVCKGFLGFVGSQPETSAPDANGAPLKPFFSLPLVITTANLYSCDNKIDEVSLGTGNLDSNLKLTEQPWIFLRHPFPEVTGGGFEDFRHSFGGNRTPAELSLQFKESVFVVNVRHLEKFFLHCQIFGYHG